MITPARTVIDALGLEPHPEGGWYRETWRGAAPAGQTRGVGTSILYLLDAGQISRWHRIDATELWLHQGGGDLSLRHWEEGDAIETRLGADQTLGHQLQAVVPPHAWQTAQAGQSWVLLACVVAPAFDFGAFELAPEGWEPPSRNPDL